MSSTKIRSGGGTSVFSTIETTSYQGGLTGAVTTRFRVVKHRNGSFSGRGTESCDACTLGGRQGGYKAMFTFRGSGEELTGRDTFLSGSGGLAGLHGGGHFATTPSGGTYSYTYRFSS